MGDVRHKICGMQQLCWYVDDAKPVPIRGSGSSAHVQCCSGDAMHDRRSTDRCADACVLPHDEDFVRASADAGIELLLPCVADRECALCRSQCNER